MISSEARRTLVKSPPELWSELSQPAALARHLAELGDVRITHMTPESFVEWEAELISGTVRLEPSGWGTKVSLTVSREPEAPESPLPEGARTDTSAVEGAELETSVLVPSVIEPDDPPAEEPLEATEPEPSDPKAIEEPHEDAGASQEAQPQPARRGFFSRLFRGFKGRTGEPLAIDPPTPQDSQVSEQAPVHEPQEQPHEAVALPNELSDAEQDAEAGESAETDQQGPDLSAELASAEESILASDTAVLVSVLDRLGAAHHRPFSRA